MTNLEISVQYRAMPYKVGPHENDEKNDVAHDTGKSDDIVDTAVEHVVDDVVSSMLVVRHVTTSCRVAESE